jgi:hypothetical protein
MLGLGASSRGRLEAFMISRALSVGSRQCLYGEGGLRDSSLCL